VRAALPAARENAGAVSPGAAASDQAARLIQDATAQADRIVTAAQVEAQRITVDAQASARAQADRIKAVARGEAQEESQRITAVAQAGAQHITATAQAEADRTTAAARAEAQRITAAAQAAAQAAARSRVGEGSLDARVVSRAAVAIFFQAELADATAGFADAHCIGGGGFGRVYHAAGLRGLFAGDLAIKKLDLSSMQGQTEFLQEVQVLGACQHEHLTPLLGFAADSGPGSGVCLVTPLMKGGSLEDRLLLDDRARQQLGKLPGAPADGFEPLSWQQRLAIATDAVRGLLFLHTPNPDTHKPAILHHDIKPSNILLGEDDRARLADMGLARAKRTAAAHLTTVTSVAGTNGYLDENYLGTGRFDESADGYAMGVVMLMLLTGRPAVDPIQQPIVGHCDVEDSEVLSLSDGNAGEWPIAVAAGLHQVGMALVKRNRERRITLNTALQRLQRLVDDHLAPAPVPEDLEERECMICMSAPRHVRFGW
jgi:vacuolar-type H+-ATPase subunit H